MSWIEAAIEAPVDEERVALSITSNSIRYRTGGAGATTKNVRTGSVQYDEDGKVERASRHPVKLAPKAGCRGVPYMDLAKLIACYIFLCKSTLASIHFEF